MTNTVPSAGENLPKTSRVTKRSPNVSWSAIGDRRARRKGDRPVPTTRVPCVESQYETVPLLSIQAAAPLSSMTRPFSVRRAFAGPAIFCATPVDRART
jgi:hypothetical protein